MITKGNKEINALYYGNKEIFSIYKGNKEIYSNNVAYDMGLGRTFNIPQLIEQGVLPSSVDYRNLTVDNFATTTTSYGWFWAEIHNAFVGTRKSYDQSTGVLTFDYYNINVDSYSWYNNHVYFIPNPEKAIKVNVGQNTNIKNMYPNLYKRLTIDNFLMLSQRGDGMYNDNGQAWVYCRGVRNYNAETGILNSYYEGGGYVGPFNPPHYLQGTTCYIVRRLKNNIN